MLNELSQVVDSLERRGTVAPSRHPRIEPMGKNRNLVVVSLDNDGKPSGIEVLPGDTAARLFRIKHLSKGSSFPGFNLPVPIRRLGDSPAKELPTTVKKLLALGKNKNSTVADLGETIRELFNLSGPQSFNTSQEKQFQRSCSELVRELNDTIPRDLVKLKNLNTLIEIVLKSKLTLPSFTESIAKLLVSQKADFDRQMLLLFQDFLFGALDWKKRIDEIGSPDYWKGKTKQDKNANQPVYLDLAFPDVAFYRVAHSETSALSRDNSQ